MYIKFLYTYTVFFLYLSDFFPFLFPITLNESFVLSCSSFFIPMDCSPPSSSVHGVLRVRILEWVVMPSSRGSS